MQAAPVAAVLLCHDLSQPRGTGTASLSRWAALCGTHATWACSPAQSQGATTPLAARLRELGVSAPAMVLGLKEDAVPTTGVHGHTSLASLLLSLILLPVHRAVSMARGAVARLRGVGSSSRRAGIDDSDSPHQHRLPEFMTREQRDAALFSEGTSLCCSPGYGCVRSAQRHASLGLFDSLCLCFVSLGGWMWTCWTHFSSTSSCSAHLWLPMACCCPH